MHRHVTNAHTKGLCEWWPRARVIRRNVLLLISTEGANPRCIVSDSTPTFYFCRLQILKSRDLTWACLRRHSEAPDAVSFGIARPKAMDGVYLVRRSGGGGPKLVFFLGFLPFFYSAEENVNSSLRSPPPALQRELWHHKTPLNKVTSPDFCVMSHGVSSYVFHSPLF